MTILGIDEVGRGCWAGPLVAGAVMLPNDFSVPPGAIWRLGDSKTLTARQRVAADKAIRMTALAVGIGWVSNVEVDALRLTAAVTLAMRRAYDAVGLTADRIIIDGSFNFLPDIKHTTAIVKADGSMPAVSAASIIAKVARDNWMHNQAASLYPGYGFDKHVGYGTVRHQQALIKLGPCPIHRFSFKPIKAYTGN